MRNLDGKIILEISKENDDIVKSRDVIAALLKNNSIQQKSINGCFR